MPHGGLRPTKGNTAMSIRRRKSGSAPPANYSKALQRRWPRSRSCFRPKPQISTPPTRKWCMRR